MYTLMLVDDDPAIREIFSIVLEKNGFRVHVVPGGKECLDFLKTTVPDLILLDIMMEPMDGWATLNAIKKNPAIRTIPVIMLTGKQPTPDELQQYGKWIEDYMMKPVDFKTLAGSLTEIIESHRNMHMEVKRLKIEGFDPAVIDEYCNLRQTIVVSKKLMHRFRDTWRVNDDGIRMQEERLRQLRITLGLPVSEQPGDCQVGKNAF
jgi:two-component system, OmpR family, response regulator